MDGFLLAYFLDGTAPDAEQVRFAVTPGRRPVRWLPLNDSRPVVESTIGEGGARDPFLVRDPRGGFHLIATDLRVAGDGDWARAVRFGSRRIVVWHSDDLVAWSHPHLADLAPADAGNAWAPKAWWDAGEEHWLVFFACARYDDPTHRSRESHQRMMVSTTTDFRHFREPRTYLDPGHDVIDASLLTVGDEIYRFSADALTAVPEAKWRQVSLERGQSPLDRGFSLLSRAVGGDVLERGEGPAPFAGIDDDGFYVIIDEFERRGCQLFSSAKPAEGWTWVPDAGLPPGARHGSVIPITAEERRRLVTAYPPGTAASRLPDSLS